MKVILALLALSALAFQATAQTIATFKFHRLGTIEVELFDDKPVTVSNFLKYASSGRYDNQFIHRWVEGFIIQGGGYNVDKSNPEQWNYGPVDTFGQITNETHVGTFRSNVYGTIAMARAGSQTNSATSQWFINLADNGGAPAHLDTTSGGYTVFGRVISNTNLLNLFVPPAPANNIFITYELVPSFPPTPSPILSTNVTYDDFIYVDLSFRRDMNVQVGENVRGLRQISWNSVAGVTNAVDFTTTLTNWTTLNQVRGTGGNMQVTDSSTDPRRYYRVRLVY
ncbi:MAG TPA: peptidylprolyl isomerase [Chthoniobacteraceae bacterium]|nr:peptidylprolyl isomerase [Chthoniobacteraceae bacterium]